MEDEAPKRSPKKIPRRSPTAISAGDRAALKKLYQDAGRPSVSALFDLSRKKGLGLTRAQVSAFLAGDDIARRFARPKKERGEFWSLNPFDLWAVDLIDMSRYSSRRPTALKWIFCALRVYDRVLYTRAIKRKTAEHTASALRSIFEEAGGGCETNSVRQRT